MSGLRVDASLQRLSISILMSAGVAGMVLAKACTSIRFAPEYTPTRQRGAWDLHEGCAIGILPPAEQACGKSGGDKAQLSLEQNARVSMGSLQLSSGRLEGVGMRCGAWERSFRPRKPVTI